MKKLNSQKLLVRLKEKVEVRMRSIWKGALSFGLVNIPVRLYSGSREKEISFSLLHKKDGSLIRYARICKEEEKEVPWDEIVKGYENEKGEFVVMDDKDFEKVDRERTKTIEILHFIAEKEIDSTFFVKPYYLEPEKTAVNAYAVLREALKKSKKVALAKYVLHNREHLAAVKADEEMLILNELRYASELIKPELNIPRAKASSKEVDMAIKLIDQLTAPFKPTAYKDTYTEDLKKLLKQKGKGRKVVPKAEKPKSAKIYDMMSLLKESLEHSKKKKIA